MESDELAGARRVVADIEALRAVVNQLEARRTSLEREIATAVTALEQRAVLLSDGGAPLAKILPLSESEWSLLRRLRQRAALPPPEPLGRELTADFLSRMSESIRLVERPVRWPFATRRGREARDRAIEYLRWLGGWHREHQVGLRTERLRFLLSQEPPMPTTLADLLEPHLGFAEGLGGRGGIPQFLDIKTCRRISGAIDDLRTQPSWVASAREASAVAAWSARAAGLTRLVEPHGSSGATKVSQSQVLWLRRSDNAWSGDLDQPVVRLDVTRRPVEAETLLRQLAAWDALDKLRATRNEEEAFGRVAQVGPAFAAALGAIVVPDGLQARSRWDRLTEELSHRHQKLLAAAVLARPDSALDPWLDLQARQGEYASRLGELGMECWIDETGTSPLYLDRSACQALSAAIETARCANGLIDLTQEEARAAGKVVRRAEVDRLLAQMPIARLKDASDGRVRVAPLANAGVRTVAEVLEWESEIEQLPGMGESSAARAVSAARSIWQATYDETPVRIDVANRSAETTLLLAKLACWDATRRAQPTSEDDDAIRGFDSIRVNLGVAQGAVLAPGESHVAGLFKEAAERLLACSERLLGAGASLPNGDPWPDFLARPADYFTMLAELGFVIEDEAKVHGDLPDEIVEAIRQQELRSDHLRASLRGYQAFAARFALVQRKVIIGDEMGLGKTVEALAVLAHLRAAGDHHFLVVCPAAVVTNWVRETASKSALRPYRLHGPSRDQEARSWGRNGGVAVTTFDSLGWLESWTANIALACVIVDEAHYVKNPHTIRSQRTMALLEACPRVMLLTGTPLENRVEEFRNLASYVRPDLVVDASDFAPKLFRRQIAPAYLRRNQEDVLAELPELVEVEEWVALTHDDRARYLRAVRDGSFMAMRQAAMLAGRASQKVQRLNELLEQATLNGRRVIVFSYFREVLSILAGTLTGEVFGPVTGAVPAAARQVIVDAFSAARGGSVLLAQIVAGGQGLNIQAASVVVICEPQLKPTIEAQAVARAHRMGQVRSVQVHRLLSEEGVDRRITEILAEKRRIFDEFARDSDIALAAPEALDVTEADLARQVVAEERERLARELSE